MFSRFQQGAALPFSPDRVDGRGFLNDEREVPRFDINLGDMNPYGNQAMVALIAEIQNSASKNPIRIFAANLYSENRYANQAFADLLCIFAAHVATTVYNDRRADPAQVIQADAPPVVEAACAGLVAQYQALEQFVPQGGEQVISEGLNRWEYVQREAQQYFGQGNQGGMRLSQPRQGTFDGGLTMGNRGFGQPAQQGNPMAAFIQGSSRAHSAPPMATQATTRAPMGFPSQRAPVSPQGYPATQVAKSTNLWGANQPIAPAPSAPRTIPVEPKAEEPKTIRLDDGRVIVSPTQYAPEVASTPERPTMAYDRAKYLHFTVKDTNGSTYETLSPLEPSMDYLKHELDEQLRKAFEEAHQGEALKVEPVKLIETRRLIPDATGTVAVDFPEDAREELNVSDAPRQIEKVIEASTLKEASFKASLEAERALGAEHFKPHHVEYLTRIVNEVVDGPKVVETIMGLKKAVNFSTLLAAIHQLKEAGDLPEDLLKVIDARLTGEFNRYAEKIYGLTFTVDSFVSDGLDALELVNTRHGTVLGGKFDRGGKEVIDRALTILSGQDLAVYLSKLPKSDRVKNSPPAVFVTSCAVTEVPFRDVDLSSHWRMEGTVNESYASELHGLLASTFARTGKLEGAEHLIRTRDGVNYFVYRSPVWDDAFVVVKDAPPDPTRYFEA